MMCVYLHHTEHVHVGASQTISAVQHRHYIAVLGLAPPNFELDNSFVEPQSQISLPKCIL